MKEDAAREAAAFADQKDDPTASSYALEFLSKHPEVTSESVPWHIHSNVTAEQHALAVGPGNEGRAGYRCVAFCIFFFRNCFFPEPTGAWRRVFTESGCQHCHSIGRWADTRVPIFRVWADEGRRQRCSSRLFTAAK